MVTFEYILESPFKPTVKHKIWLQRVIRNEGKIPGNIAYIFCGDDYMLERNNTFLSHDTYTDIITFDECVGDIVSGSILISLDRIAENANIFGSTFEKELMRVLVHGTLHLCGYKDKSDDESVLMRKKENEALSLFANIIL